MYGRSKVLLRMISGMNMNGSVRIVVEMKELHYILKELGISCKRRKLKLNSNKRKVMAFESGTQSGRSRWIMWSLKASEFKLSCACS